MQQGETSRIRTRLRRMALMAASLSVMSLSGLAHAGQTPNGLGASASDLPGFERSVAPVANDSSFESVDEPALFDDDKVTERHDSDTSSTTLSALQSPLSSYRITSEFGWRHQPLVKVKLRYYVKSKNKKSKKGVKAAKAKQVKYRYAYARPKRPIEQFHKGVDMAAPEGTSVHVALDGTIEKLGRKGGYGNFILVRHADGVETAYAHLSSIPQELEVGQSVSTGDVIGYVGSTGRSTGPHVHYEVRVNGEPVDPEIAPL